MFTRSNSLATDAIALILTVPGQGTDRGKTAPRGPASSLHPNTEKEPKFNNPKNGKGRSLKLTHTAMDALRRHKIAQGEERQQLGSLWEDHDLVFPSQTGRPMRAWTLIGGPFKRIWKRAGLPEKTRFHDLRHTCATLLLTQGVHPKFVQELLGHATISITLDTYFHVLPGMGDQTAVAMENALG
jgi:integrase